MSTWKIGDVVVTTDGKSIRITGDGAFADQLRRGRPGDSVGIIPPPSGDVPLRVDSAWLVDRWVRQWAARMSAGEVTSDYEPSDDDVPDDARELLAEHAADGEYVEDRVY